MERSFASSSSSKRDVDEVGLGSCPLTRNEELEDPGPCPLTRDEELGIPGACGIATKHTEKVARETQTLFS